MRVIKQYRGNTIISKPHLGILESVLEKVTIFEEQREFQQMV